MINDYASLTSAIESYLFDRKDLAPSIPYFIDAAEKKLYRRLRIPANEQLLSLTEVGQSVALPADYLETKMLSVAGQSLSRISDAEYLRRYYWSPATGTPKAFARIGSELLVHPVASGEAASLVYYADYSGNLEQSLPSPIFDIAPDLYLHGALGEASAFLGQDSRVPLWKAAYNDTLGDLQQQAVDEEFSGNGLAVQNSQGSRGEGYYGTY